MSKQIINWGKWSALAIIASSLVVFGPWTISQVVHANDVWISPQRENALEMRMTALETNCSSNFQSLHKEIQDLKR